MTKTTLDDALLTDVRARLQRANEAFAAAYPGDAPRRQPVHTVYGGAHLFKAGTAGKIGGLGLRVLRAYAPDFAALAKALEIPGHETLPTTPDAIAALDRALTAGEDTVSTRAARLPWTVYQRVVQKLETEGVEDFRIDFEDGYGYRPNEEEDAQAVIAAQQVAAGLEAGTLPPFLGIRIKPLTEELRERGIRTLDLFFTALAEATGGRMPENFVITLPKVTIPEQVEALVSLCALLEANTQLAAGSLKIELMIETPQSIIDADGRIAVTRLVQAGDGRVTGCHFGTYDYTALCNITAAYQAHDHPASDFATHTMQVALAQQGVWMSDGATVIMPIAPHRAPKDGPPLTAAQVAENTAAVHSAWRLAYNNNLHSLRRGIYQGWDLHPGQLVTRYAAIYTFFLSSLADASLRLKNFVGKAAQATLSGHTFDDAATGQGLINYFLRALNCGAITGAEVADTGLTIDELQTKSFARILEGRWAD